MNCAKEERFQAGSDKIIYFLASHAFYLTDKGEVFHNPREKKGW